MFHSRKGKTLRVDANAKKRSRLVVCGLSVALIAGAIPAWTQDQQPTNSSQPTTQSPDNGKPKQDTPPDAGGPGGNVGPYVIPKKTTEDAPAPPPPVTPKKIEDIPDYSLKVNVPLVNVDVLVTTKDGQFVPGLKKDNFRITEDGVPQNVTHFSVSKAPITAVLLVEFASTNYFLMIDALRASYAFADSLKKDDWIAVAYYDMQPHILADFTQDKKAVYGAD